MLGQTPLKQLGACQEQWWKQEILEILRVVKNAKNKIGTNKESKEQRKISASKDNGQEGSSTGESGNI